MNHRIISGGTSWTANDIRNMNAEEFTENFGRNWDAIAELMDEDTREAVHTNMAPCTEQAFLAAYLDKAGQDLYI